MNYCFPRFYFTKFHILKELLRTFFNSLCNYFFPVSSSTSLSLWNFQQTGLSILDMLQDQMFTPEGWLLKEDISVHDLVEEVLSKQYSSKAVLREDRAAGRTALLSPLFAESWPSTAWRVRSSSVHRAAQDCSHTLWLGWIRASHLYLTSNRINCLIQINQVLRCFSGLAAEYVNKG